MGGWGAETMRILVQNIDSCAWNPRSKQGEIFKLKKRIIHSESMSEHMPNVFKPIRAEISSNIR